MLNPNGDEEKVVVDVEVRPEWSLTKMLEVAGQFAHGTQSVARFKRGDDVFKVWYVDFTHAPNDAWRGTRNGAPLPRFGHKWGEFKEIE